MGLIVFLISVSGPLSRTHSLARGVRPLRAPLNPPAAHRYAQKMAPAAQGPDPDLDPNPGAGPIEAHADITPALVPVLTDAVPGADLRSWESPPAQETTAVHPCQIVADTLANRANPDPNNCLGVFGLSLYTTERDLREVFSKYGPLSAVNIVYDQQSRRSRGFAFVYFETREDSKELLFQAKERANGMELDGRRIRVDFSITKRAHTPTPGIYMGRPTYGGGSGGSGGGGGGSSSSSGGGGGSSSQRNSRDCDRGSVRSYDRSYDRDYERDDDREYRSYRRRSPSPYYSRGYRSRSRSRSYSPRHY
nr:transformer-2 protein homolog alpha-like isoform X2 [Pseudochaenichthys georgianus]